MKMKTILKVICSILLLTSLFSFITSAQVKGVVGSEGKWGLVDGSGKMIVTHTYDYMGNNGKFSEGMISVWLNNQAGYIDTTGKIIVPLIYDEAFYYSQDGIALVKIGHCYRYIDKNAKCISEVDYESAGTFSDGLAVVSKDILYGFIDTEGYEIIPLMYSYAESFFNERAKVEFEGKSFYIDKLGRQIMD